MFRLERVRQDGRVDAVSTSQLFRGPLLLTAMSVMTLVFVLDTGLTTWHNSPPRLVLRELEIGLVCPESCFQPNRVEIVSTR
jgi:hypothetical protein